MALTFIGSAQTTSATPATPSGARTGDFVCVVAFRQGSATAPTVPSGWTQLAIRSVSPALVVAGRIWDGNAFPTFTNATSCHSEAWEGFDVATPYGAQAVGGGTSTTVTFPAITTQLTNATSHVVRGAVDQRPDVQIPTPAGHTLIFATTSPGSSFAYGTYRIGPVTSPGAINVTVSRSSAYSTVSFEVRAAQTAPAASPTPTFSNVAFNNVRVNWASPAGTVERVTVQRAAASGGPWTDIADLPRSTVLFDDTNPISPTSWYRIVAKNGAGSFNGTAASQVVPARPVSPSGIASAESFGALLFRERTTTLTGLGAIISAGGVPFSHAVRPDFPKILDVIDNFDRADEAPINGSIWGGAISTGAPNGLAIVGNKLVNPVTTGAPGDAVTVASFGPDVEFYADLAIFTGESAFLFARMQNAAAANWSAYYVQYDVTTALVQIIYHKPDNSETVLASHSDTNFAFQSLGISVVGNVITAYTKHSDSGWLISASAVDSNITGAGKLGVSIASPSTTATIDNLSGGSLTSAALPSTVTPASGIASGEAFGTPLVNHGQNILLNPDFEVDVADWVVSNNPAGNVVTSARARSTVWAESGVGALRYTATRDAGTANTDMGVATTQRYPVESAHTEILRFVVNLNSAPSGGMVVQLAWINAAGAGVSNSNFFFTGLAAGRYVITASADPPATATRVFPVIRVRSNTANESVSFDIDDVFLGFGARVVASGIASAESFGTLLSLRQSSVLGAGIASAETFGSHTVSKRNTVTTTGIVSAEAFGSSKTIAPELVENLYDPFNGPTVDPVLWSNGGAFISAGAVEVDANSLIDSKARYRLAGSNLVFKVTQGMVGAWQFGTQPVLGMYSFLGVGAENLYFSSLDATNLLMFKGATQVGSVAYNSGTMAWLRISEAGGTVTFATSPDGNTWTTRATTPTPGTVQAGIVTFEGAVGGTTRIDQVGKLVTKTAAPSGIPSAEGFGSTTAIHKKTLGGAGIASAESFGTTSLIPAAWLIAPTGIPSAQAFGTLTVLKKKTLAATGIASAEAFGTVVVKGKLALAGLGIPSAEAFGVSTVLLRKTISIAGIASAEGFGTSAVKGRLTLTGSGIASAQAFGTTQLKAIRALAPTGIGSAEAFGTSKVNRTLPLAGIASVEAFGTARVSRTIKLNGIASAEAFGTSRLALRITLAGIASAESFGATQVLKRKTLVASGIPSAESFGTTRVNRTVPLSGGSVTSTEAFGTANIIRRVALTGVASAESFGALTVTKRYSVNTTGISSQESFGTPTLRARMTLGMGSVASAEAVSTPTVRGILVITTFGIPSGEAFGAEFVGDHRLIVRRRVGRTGWDVLEPATRVVDRSVVPTGVAVQEPLSDVTIREPLEDYVELLAHVSSAVVTEPKEDIDHNTSAVTAVIELKAAPTDAKEL